MAKLNLRQVLGRLLTAVEVDANFQGLNSEIANVECDFYGDVDPTTIDGLTVGPGFKWAHKAQGLLKRRNVDNTLWVPESRLYSLSALATGQSDQKFLVAPGTTGNEAIAFSQAIGLGQTWQDLTASRAMGTNYVNSTPKPIAVSIYLIAAIGSHVGAMLVISGAARQYSLSPGLPGASAVITLFGIVPPLAGYSVTFTSGSIVSGGLSWSELR